MVGRRRKGFNDTIPLRDLRLRVCLAGLLAGIIDAAAMVKGFITFVRALDSSDSWSLNVIIA